MRKYIVEKVFRDRFDNDKTCNPGEPHDPPNEERARQLLELGFISEVLPEVEEKSKKRGRKPKNDPVGESDGEETEDQ
ncbi:hypothetical protein GOL43_34410 [Sinorhizobium medicae]|nr:hypothetical protein [Sinorhizobium medicae]